MIEVFFSPLQAGVAVNAADFKGLTPLMTACMFGKAATAAFLLGSGAQCHLTDINGDTALHWAAYKGHPELIRLLMYSGVDLQKPDYFGSTPLHLACLSGNVNCARILCEKSKIELEPKDKNGKTPLQLARAHRHADVVGILQAEQKRRSRWIPPMNELWYYSRSFTECQIILPSNYFYQGVAVRRRRQQQRAPSSVHGLCIAVGLPNVHVEVRTVDLGRSQRKPLLFHLLEHRNVDIMDSG